MSAVFLLSTHQEAAQLKATENVVGSEKHHWVDSRHWMPQTHERSWKCCPPPRSMVPMQFQWQTTGFWGPPKISLKIQWFIIRQWLKDYLLRDFSGLFSMGPRVPIDQPRAKAHLKTIALDLNLTQLMPAGSSRGVADDQVAYYLIMVDKMVNHGQ